MRLVGCARSSAAASRARDRAHRSGVGRARHSRLGRRPADVWPGSRRRRLARSTPRWRFWRDLDAVDEAGALTSTGRALRRIPLHPRLGRMLLAGRGGAGDRASLRAAVRAPSRAAAPRRDVVRSAVRRRARSGRCRRTCGVWRANSRTLRARRSTRTAGREALTDADFRRAVLGRRIPIAWPAGGPPAAIGSCWRQGPARGSARESGVVNAEFIVAVDVTSGRLGAGRRGADSHGDGHRARLDSSRRRAASTHEFDAGQRIRSGRARRDVRRPGRRPSIPSRRIRRGRADCGGRIHPSRAHGRRSAIAEARGVRRRDHRRSTRPSATASPRQVQLDDVDLEAALPDAIRRALSRRARRDRSRCRAAVSSARVPRWRRGGRGGEAAGTVRPRRQSAARSAAACR